MPNQPTIIVTVTEEPPAYHAVDDDNVRIFAVHLTFDGQEADVKSLLEFREWQFRAYAWAAPQATLIEKVKYEVIASPPTNPIPADRLMDWLKTVADFQQQGTSVGGDVELPSTAAAGNPIARDVLGGSIAWDAPIPQDLGLTYLVKYERTEAAWPDRLLILPLDQSGQPANTSLEGVETPANVVTISITPFGGFPGVNIRTSVLSAPPESLPTPLADAGRGFLASSFDPDDFRVIEAIEAKGASLVWALPVFLGFLSKTITECQDDPDKTRAIISRNTAVAIGCQLAFDPIVLALGEEKSDREGVLLSGLAALLHSQLSEGEPAISAVEKAEKIKALIKSVRAAVPAKAQLPVLGDGESDSYRTALAALGVPEDIVNTLFPSPGSKDLASVRDGLNALMTHVQSEQGIETALKAVLKPLADSETDQAVKTALAQFIAALDTGVNAADAVRAEVGHRMVKEVVNNKNLSGTSLQNSLKGLNLYAKRVGDAPLGPRLPLTIIPDSCKRYLENAWEPAVEAMLPVAAGSERRFQPDSVPQPLPISISPVPGAENLGDFTSRFNGVGVIIRSASPTAQGANGFGPWAHANLAAFDVWQPNGGDKQPYYETLSPPDRIGIRAFLPVAVDGRQEMFLRYHGFPLSSDAYRDTIRDDGTQSGLTAQRLPFYAARDVIPSGFQKVPRLVYGRSYEWAAFAVTKGGSLPKILQHTDIPWIPKGECANPPDGTVGTLNYLRRTAVGATTIVDQERQPARIGVRYPEVFPLALDAPRLCLSAINAGDHVCRASLDLFRNADGSGQLGTEVGDMWTVDCRRLLVTNPEGKAVRLFVEWCRWKKEGVAVMCTASADVSTQDGKDLSLKAQRTDPPAGPCDAWLRLRLETEATYASLAFDPPTVTVKRENAPAPTAGAAGDLAGTAGESSESEANKRPAAGDPLPCHADTPPVLLVGADACWTGGFTKSAFAEIILPRVTWLDWEHWCGNQSLAMYGCGRSAGDVFSKADGHLLTASVLRSLDDEINRLLDRLPDPSVSALIVELTVIDNLLGQRGSARDSSSQDAMSVVIDCSKISGEAFDEVKGLNTKARLYGSDLRSCLIHADKRCRIGVVVNPIESSSNPSFALSGDNDKKAIVIKVCEGTVARLTIRPFVEWPKNGHPAFHEGIRQLAVGEATVKNKRGYVFEGATLTIEAMHDPFNKEKEKLKDLATQHESVLQRHIDIVPVANVRDYRVFFGPHVVNGGASAPSEEPLSDPWRLFSHVEMRTQRWRFSGRPIYGWIDPNKSAKRQGENGIPRLAGCPAVEQETSDAIKRFEAELFFDRDDADCEFTRVRLTGGRDELLACPWELPSATYFRHAFNFVSRYAGAMRPGSGVPLLPRRQADWSHRVAMLADAPRLEVTRPQARCIVPLTTSPDDDGPAAASPDIEQRRLAPTPPVACILEERPFAVGGLAERMLGEIVTGVGYGFEGKTTDGGTSDGDASRVQPLDFAKETSRDGRLSAWAWTPPALPAKDNEQPPKNPSRSFVVETEGPVGLHFEEVMTPAPAWSNCQYLLRPRSLDNGVPLPEESFLGVQLRRFLDPDWIFEPGLSDGRGQDDSGKTSMPWPVQDPCIVRYKMDKVPAPSRSLVSVALGDPRRSSPLVTCERKGATLVISARVNFLGAGYREESRVLCELPVPSSGPESPVPSSRRSDELALLHMPHGDGSFTMSVAFLPDDAAATEGRSTAPLIVGTFRWTLNHLVSGGSSAGTGTAGRSSSGAPAATSTPAEGSSSPADQGSANKSAMLELLVIDGQCPVVRRTAMSQPTYREWTRTAKNADFVTAMINSGIDEPVRVADLAATIKTNSGLEFRRAAGIAPSPHAALQNLWLCSSLENSRMPLFVHRYLVGVFTKNASRGGRRYPSFSQARLLVGRNPALPRHLQPAQADSLTIHEMEVPAKIVVGGNSQQGPLKRFKKAVIDLRATGGRPSDAEPGTVMAYRLHVRFTNSPAAMKETTAEVHVKTAQGMVKIEVPNSVQSLDVMWTSAKSLEPRVWFITCIGAQGGEKPTIDPAARPVSKDSVEVTIPTCASSCGELWADVSLLHRAVPDTWVLDDESFDHFTFDWLFSAAAAQDDRFPDRRTLVKTLAERFEAQGRFVSSSPPIPITNVQQ